MDQADFVARLRTAVVIGDDGYNVDAPAVLNLVSESPNLTARSITQGIRLAAEQPRLLRVAEVLAVAYRIVHFDDIFERQVEVRCRELGRKPAQVQGERDGTTVVLTLSELFDLCAQARGPDQIAVSRAELKALEIYPLLKRFSVDHRSPADLRDLKAMRGRFRLLFLLEDDPREVVFVPEVRRFVGKLVDALPFFPYYLDLSQGAGMVALLLGCLADRDAVVPQPNGGWGINPYDPSVMEILATWMVAIGFLGSQLDDDPAPVCEQLLQGMPPDLTSSLLELVLTGVR